MIWEVGLQGRMIFFNFLSLSSEGAAVLGREATSTSISLTEIFNKRGPASSREWPSLVRNLLCYYDPSGSVQRKAVINVSYTLHDD